MEPLKGPLRHLELRSLSKEMRVKRDRKRGEKREEKVMGKLPKGH